MATVYTVTVSITENGEPTMSDTYMDQLGELVELWESRGMQTSMQVTSSDS